MEMNEALVQAYASALRALDGRAPKGLVRRAILEAEDMTPVPDVSEPILRQHLAECGPNDQLHLVLHLALAKWDQAKNDDNPWTSGTKPRTDERRALVVKSLGLDNETAAKLAEEFPVLKGDGVTVIEGSWDPWYTPEVRLTRSFYWEHYIDYLRLQRGWGAEAIASLDEATTNVMERVTDPSRAEPGQTKGLVVGYVQSGKTANFTGVIAKAIDAGYRLIIVMTGTTNLLREQTQRRIDRDVVGRENVLRGTDESDPTAQQSIDYLEDEDWIEGRFVSHGARPSDVGRPNIHRMTTRDFDYRKLQQGLPALEFERRDRTRPLWDRENLFASDARLIIVKKYSTVLKNLVKDLKTTGDKLDDIPAIIIDDESDQASINTTNPKKWSKENKKRTAINECIHNLLEMLPRAQYIGYTATPFANVFVDPSDAKDIFPSNYLISLPRPKGYMGADDFHDLDGIMPDEEKTFANSNERAYIRILDDAEDEDGLQRALDSFVLTGAIKLLRRARGVGEFKHHMMLVHQTMRIAGHRASSDAIRQIWDGSGYLSGGATGRLRKLFEEDFAPATAALKLGYAEPENFDDVNQNIAAVARKIAPNGDPVIVVNSDKDIEKEHLDFDKRPIWRVLVGGNALSRGFTVEDLTVTFYSRNVGHAEALMQMGRWFGFRPGYRDLVRLFITRSVRDAFEATCRDEEYFRDELRQYAIMVDGRPKITPDDLPPLVARHGLRPTAANKMYNARLVERRALRMEPSSGYPSLRDQAALDINIQACVPLLEAATDRQTLELAKGSFEALVGTVDHNQMISVLSQLRWARADTFAPELTWLATLSGVIKNWIVILPQQQNRSETVNLGGVGQFSVHGRKVEPGERIRGNADPRQREKIGELQQSTTESGYMLLYPVKDKTRAWNTIEQNGRPSKIVMALTLSLPKTATPSDHQPVCYQVAIPRRPLYELVDMDAHKTASHGES
jgi:hypothetical protein